MIVGRDGESVRDSDGSLSLRYSRIGYDLRLVISIGLSQLKFAYIAQ